MEKHWNSREILLSVPLDYQQPNRASIEIFAQEVWLSGMENAPICVFLQGGPGFESPKDLSSVAWLPPLLKQFRVLLLDQRGTGRSTPIGPELTHALPNVQEQLEYIIHFRADNIVRDLEQIRTRLYLAKTWYLLGQSFGGFISCHYLSYYPEALAGVFICGGLPPLMLSDAKQVYQALTPMLKKRSKEYFERYPEDKIKVKKILALLEASPYSLPDSGTFTTERFRDTGIILGTTNGFQRMHALLSQAFTDSSEQQLRWAFIESFKQQTDYETNPLYFLLHEAIYCQLNASHWAAYQTVIEDPEYGQSQECPMFWGETVRPDMVKEYAQLKGFAQLADKLANYTAWPTLYNTQQLATNPVPVQCIVYEQDYYVDFQQSLNTAAAIKNCSVWVHPNWQHDAIRAHGDQLIPELLERFFTFTNSLK